VRRGVTAVTVGGGKDEERVAVIKSGGARFGLKRWRGTKP